MDSLLIRGGALVVLVALVLLFGLWRHRTDGRARGVTDGAVVTGADLGADLGPRATLLQISTRYCQPCRAVHRVLADVAGRVPGVAHLVVDAERRPELVDRLGVVRTPTVLVIDGSGRVLRRASGVMTTEQVHAALGAAVPEVRGAPARLVHDV